MAFCRERTGTVKSFTCPYHQWNYNLKVDLTGLPFRRGVKQGGRAPISRLAKATTMIYTHVPKMGGGAVRKLGDAMSGT